MSEQVHEEKDVEEAKEVKEVKKPSNLGKVEWIDLTVKDAPKIRDFYASVVGWNTDAVPMGNYDDFNMNLPGSTTAIAGICHAKGSNANLPPQWLMYVRVASVSASVNECESRGGKILDGPRRLGSSRFAVIEDPAGAVMALISD
jgi:hypothetical protein